MAREQLGEARQAAPRIAKRAASGGAPGRRVDAVVAGDAGRDRRRRMQRRSARILLLAMPARRSTLAPILYRVSMSEPASHEFEVEMDVPALPGATAPRSSSPPGRPAATWCATSSVTSSDLAVTDGRGRPLRAERLDKQRWRMRDRRAGLPRPLPGLCVRGQRAHVVPRRQPRLLERHQRLLLRRGRAGRPCRVDGGAAAARRVAGRDRAAAPSPGAATYAAADFDELCDSPVRGRHARDARASRSGARVRAGALRPHQRRHAPPGRHPRAASSPRRGDVRRLPVRPLPLHRARAAGRLGRPRAPRVGDDGHRRARRSRTRPATSASPIWPRTSSFTPGT